MNLILVVHPRIQKEKNPLVTGHGVLVGPQSVNRKLSPLSDDWIGTNEEIVEKVYEMTFQLVLEMLQKEYTVHLYSNACLSKSHKLQQLLLLKGFNRKNRGILLCLRIPQIVTYTGKNMNLNQTDALSA